jgi:hypothetical protein
MDEAETLAESIRRKVSEKKAEVQKSLSECDTTEVSASQMQLRQSGAVANLNLAANPLLPMCIVLAAAVVILSVLLLVAHIGH